MLQTCMSRTVTTEKSQSDKEYSYCVQTRERERDTFEQRFWFLGANFHQLANLLFSKEPKNY
jgi:hypothetical protein